MGRSLSTFTYFLFISISFSLFSCNGEPPCFNPPLLTDSGGLSIQINLDGDALPLDASRDGSFSIGGKFTGHVFGISGQSSIDTTLSAHQASAAPALALYGPRASTGLFGIPIAQTCGAKGQASRLSAILLDQPGDYLIITADPAGAGGDYSLELSCNSGCEQTQCEPLVCDLYCPAGLVLDNSGCRVCECSGCISDTDCPRGFVCEGTTCLRENLCRCENQPYDPVCGVDGRTYPNECELECANVDKGVCPPGCTSDADCPAGTLCRNGECVLTCDCSEYGYQPVCGTDGQTYFNDCERLCAGIGLDHLGECDQCSPEVCDRIDNDCDGIIDEGCYGECTSDADCETREICWDGLCILPVLCTSDADCPAGQVCENGICRGDVGCQSVDQCDDSDPGTEDHCANEVCVNLDICSADADCLAGQVCYSGICMGHGACVTDQDCAIGDFCEPNMGVCVTNINCRTNLECPTGQVCHLQTYCVP